MPLKERLAAFASLAESNECLVAYPCGRGNDIATDIGANDVFQVIEDVARRYSIARDRISLLGYGLGGVASWRLACFYPDRWAAVAIVDSGADEPPAQPGNLLSRAVRGSEPKLLEYAPNLMHVPMLLHLLKGKTQMGAMDWLAAADALEQLKYDVDRVIHDAAPAGEVEPGIFKWLVGQSRSISPRSILQRTPCASYGKAYWGEILQMEDPTVPAELAARASGTGSMVVECKNAKRFALDLGAGQYPDEAFVDVIVNQSQNPVMCPKPRRYVIGPVGQDPWLWKEVTEAPVGPVKGAGLEGPMGRVFSSDFAVVAGSGRDDPSWSAAVHKTVEDFRLAWRDRYGCDPIVLQDIQLTEETIRDRHVVLVGTARTNSPLAGVGAALPVRTGSQGEVMVGARTFKGADVGFGVVYPNPANPRRLVLALNGTSPNAMGELLRACTFQKDYEVFQVDSNRAAEILAEGAFDSSWALPEFR
jgi:pimeloyl-ACP methyl ester carboxylesterase